ncbi:MFS transporter [Asanoa hainanensis]|nr:MFS transporter [Asanoa hainanensis]
MVISALIPYLVLSAALQPLTGIIGADLGMSAYEVNLAQGLANAGYALGTVLSVQLAQHLPQRRMLIIYGVLLVVGSVLAAAATGTVMFISGHVLQGLCTSLLLIAAVPPLVTGFPPSKIRYTAVVLNMGIFGAVALGPLIGGIQADANGWRPLFWVIAGIAILAFVLILLTYQEVPAADPTATRSPLPVALAATGCIAAFFGATQLLTHRELNAAALAPLTAGVLVILVLLVNQYFSKRPLLIVRPLTSTMPVSGIIAAMSAAAASVSAITLSGLILADRYSPLKLGLLYLPEFGGAVITTILFAILFTTKGLHYFALTGLLCLSAGIALIAGTLPPSTIVTLVGTGLIGVGVGASVAPSLFIAGFSLRNAALQRVFAIVELLRAVAAFMIAPILVYIATTVMSNTEDGVRTALWICLGLSAAGALVGIALYWLGRVKPPTPSLANWFGGETAWYSPPLFARYRKNAKTPEQPSGPPEVEVS